MVARCGFDAEVVDDKTEGDVAPDVAPKARSVLAVIVALGVETLFK
jgi:hypothetical protein